MADVKEHLALVQEQIELMRLTSKLMSSSERGDLFELGKHGPTLLNTFASMLNGMADRIEENLKDLDLAISIKGHSKT